MLRLTACSTLINPAFAGSGFALPTRIDCNPPRDGRRIQKNSRLFASALVVLGMLGASPHVMAQSFTNSAPIAIGSDPGSPYPSSIPVAGLGAGTKNFTVTLHGYSHTFPRDTDVLLVAPDGRKIMLMSDVATEIASTSVLDAELTFSAAATNIMTDPVTSGTWLPTNLDDSELGDGGSDVFPAPAPAGPYSSDPNDLSGDGLSFNGVWQLFVRDDYVPLDPIGSISGGWTLNFESVTPPTTCASEGYKGAQLTWCKNICENGLTGAVLDTWIHRWINRYRDLPYCAVEEELPPT